MTTLLTTTEAAEILGIAPTSVSVAIKRGHLKAKKWGRQYQLELSNINAYKDSRRNINRKDLKKDLT